MALVQENVYLHAGSKFKYKDPHDAITKINSALRSGAVIGSFRRKRTNNIMRVVADANLQIAVLYEERDDTVRAVHTVDDLQIAVDVFSEELETLHRKKIAEVERERNDAAVRMSDTRPSLEAEIERINYELEQVERRAVDLRSRKDALRKTIVDNEKRVVSLDQLLRKLTLSLASVILSKRV